MNNAIAHAASPRTRPNAGPVVRSVLCSRTHSAANRRLAKDIVWRWVSARWPFLAPTAAVMERSHIESSLPGRSLVVGTSEDGAVWTLTVSIQERESAPRWTTRAMVANADATDQVAVETSCSDISAARVVAPPAVLAAWVERLELDDGGVPVLRVPRMVQDEQQAQALMEQVTRAGRQLPVVLLAAKGQSRYYGADPKVLAQSVCGLAHVACLAPAALRAWSSMCGRARSPVPGAAHVYLPGFARANASAQQNLASFPVQSRSSAAHSEGGTDPTNHLRPILRQLLCGLSVGAAG